MNLRNLVRLLVELPLGLLVAVLLAVSLVWSTESGTRLVLESAAEQVEGLSFGELSGSAAGGISVTGLLFENETVTVRGGSVYLEPSLFGLLAGELRLIAPTLADIEVAYRTPPPSDQPTKPINIPITIALREARATDIGIRIDDRPPILIDTLDFDLTLGGDRLTVDIAAIESDARALRGHASARLYAPFDYSGRIELIAMPGLPDGASPHATFTGNAAKLQANAVMMAPTEVRASADIDFSGSAHISLMTDLASLTADGTFTLGDSPRVDAALDGSLDGKPVTGSLNAYLDAGEPVASMRLEQGNNAIGLNLVEGRLLVDASIPELSSLHTGLTGSANGAGHLDLDTARFEATATADGSGFRELTAERIQLSASGVADADMDVEIQLRALTSGDVPIGSGTLVLFGRPVEAALQLDWQRDSLAASLGGRLRLDNGGPSITLVRGQLTGLPVAPLALADPTTLTWREGRGAATDHCWRVGDADDVCFSAMTLTPEQVSLGLSAGRIALPSAGVQGLSADIRFSIPDAVLTARASADEASPGAVPFAASGLDVSATGPLDRLTITALATLQAGEMPTSIEARAILLGNGLKVSALKLTNAEAMIETRGRWDFANGVVEFDVDGEIRNRKLRGGGRVGLRPELSGDAHVALGQGAAEVVLTATPSEATLDLDITRLGALVSGLEGAVRANAVLSPNDGQWRVDASGTGLNGYGARVESLTINGTGRGDRDLDVTATLLDVERGTVELAETRLILSGSPDLYRARIGVSGRPVDADLDIRFGVTGDIITGELAEAVLAFPRNRWTLTGTVPFSASAATGGFDPHCWVTGDARFCVQSFRWDESSGLVEANMRDAPIDFRGAVWAPEVAVAGAFDLTLSGRAPRPFSLETMAADIDLSAPALTVTYFDEDSVEARVAGQATLANGALEASLEGNTAAGDQAMVRGSVPDVANIDRFVARTSLESDNLGIVTAFVPQLDRAAGSVAANMSIDTRRDRTSADIDVRVTDGASVVVPAAGIEITGIEFAARGDAERMTLNLSGRSGDGTLTATGAIESPLSAERSLELDISGETLTALNRADVRLVTSPRLRYFYQGTGTGRLTGNIEVDDGRFALTELQATGRSVSPDVVVVARERTVSPLASTDLDLDIDIEKFAIDLYGLRGDVRGNVDLVQRPGTPRRVNGTVNLLGGSFARYGQRFSIERGRLVFSGPMTNPLIDVVSVRTIEEPDQTVRVSLALSGPANNIRSSISATPAMSEARALSYLILGRSLQSANAADENALSGAALALGLRQAAPVTEEIRKQLGLEALTLSSEGMDSATVIAGKKLSDDLYVEYTYDVIGRMSGLQLEYRLTDRLSLLTHTGEQKSMQLIYLID